MPLKLLVLIDGRSTVSEIRKQAQSVATFERAKRPDTVAVFPILPDGRILLTKQDIRWGISIGEKRSTFNRLLKLH